MPNWCSNIIVIEEGNKPEIEKLGALIQKWTSQSYVKNGFGDNWLGNIVYGAGFKRSDEDKESGFKCRGSITDMDLNEEDGILCITTETAWGPMNEMWHAIIEKFAPNSFFQCCSEEPGNEYFCIEEDKGCTRYFQDDYFVEVWSENNKNFEPWILELFSFRSFTRERLKKVLAEKFGNKQIEELVQLANDYMEDIFKEDGFGHIYKYERVIYNPETKELKVI